MLSFPLSLNNADILVLGPQGVNFITGNEFQISLQPVWQIDTGFLNKPIIAHTQILVYRFWPRTRISVLLRKRPKKEPLGL